MIVLTETTDNLQAVLGGTVAANQVRCFSSWRDITATAYTPGRTGVLTNNTTDVNVVAAPASSTQRVVDLLSFFNLDSASATLTVKLDANGTEFILWRGVLATEERLEYVDGQGFRAFTAQGAEKVQQSIGLPSNASGETYATITSNVINNNATANTLADVTGLVLPITAGTIYWFKAEIPYSSAATTTGSRWTINGPAFTRLNYRSTYTLTATTVTTNGATAYQIPAASNASSLTLGNVAEIEGIILPASSGNLQVQFASEVSSSAITALAGATLKLRAL